MTNQQSTINNRKSIGYIVGGGLKESFRARLEVPANEVQEGAFVVIENLPWHFYGLVTDIQLGSTDPRFADEQSEVRFPPGIARLLHGQTLYTNLEVLPALMYDIGPEPGTAEYQQWASAVDAGLRGLAVFAGDDIPGTQFAESAHEMIYFIAAADEI